MSGEEKTAIEQARETAQTKADEVNKTRSGVGTRVFVGATRGRNVQVISYEGFDDSQPDTLPKSIKEFMDASQVTAEADLVKRLIIGHNDLNYTEASDPIKEFLNPEWDDELKNKFRANVRGIAGMQGLSIEETVNLIKPGVDKKFYADQAAAQAAKLEAATA